MFCTIVPTYIRERPDTTFRVRVWFRETRAAQARPQKSAVLSIIFHNSNRLAIVNSFSKSKYLCKNYEFVYPVEDTKHPIILYTIQQNKSAACQVKLVYKFIVFLSDRSKCKRDTLAFL